MSFYSEASLVYVASAGAGKDGKAYSIKPTDGTGDFTFSRGSNLAATRVGPDGLIEKGRENLLLQSNQFDTTWGMTRSSLTGNQSGYDGSTDAWKLIGTTPADGVKDHYLRQSFSVTGVLTVSGYFKAAEKNTIRILFNNSDPTPRADFDLANGSVHNKSNVIAASIVSVGNGWYRCSVTGILTVSAVIQIYATESLNATSWVGDDTSGVYIQDAQLESSLVATEYIESGATTGKAGLLEDEPRFDYSGGATCPSLLLEPSRTNIIQSSEYFQDDYWAELGIHEFDTNTTETTSPTGDYSATKIVADTTSNSNHVVYGDVALSINTQYAVSIFAKAAEYDYLFIRGLGLGASGGARFNISAGEVVAVNGYDSATIEDYGNGWYRCIAVGTSTTTGAPYYHMSPTSSFTPFAGNNSDGIYIFGAQCEAGPYPTSYIPNHSGGTITRDFDYSIVESLGYSSACTFYYEFNTTTGREGSSPFAEIGKDNSNKFYIKGSSADSPQFQVQGNGIFSGSIGPTNEVSGINKIAVQWSSGVGVVFSNGVKQSGTLTNSNTSENIDFISMKGNGTSHDSKQLLFFEEVLSDADCITLTTI